jgi:hypothetical protein
MPEIMYGTRSLFPRAGEWPSATLEQGKVALAPNRRGAGRPRIRGMEKMASIVHDRGPRPRQERQAFPRDGQWRGEVLELKLVISVVEYIMGSFNQ